MPYRYGTLLGFLLLGMTSVSPAPTMEFQYREPVNEAAFQTSLFSRFYGNPDDWKALSLLTDSEQKSVLTLVENYYREGQTQTEVSTTKKLQRQKLLFQELEQLLSKASRMKETPYRIVSLYRTIHRKVRSTPQNSAGLKEFHGARKALDTP